jgi:hypothetical protein
MTLIGLSAFTMVTIVGLVLEADAQTPCSELARLRGEAAEAWKQATKAPASERCGSYIRLSLAAKAMVEYANNHRESCDISVQSLNQMEGSHRDAVKARDNVCAERPLRPYPAEIIQR